MTRLFDPTSHESRTASGKPDAARRGDRRRVLDRRFGHVVRRFHIDLPAEQKTPRGASGAGREKKA